MAGVASPPVAANAPAPAEPFKNVLRSIGKLSQLNSMCRPKLRQSATSFGVLHTPCEAEARAADVGALTTDLSKPYAIRPLVCRLVRHFPSCIMCVLPPFRTDLTVNEIRQDTGSDTGWVAPNDPLG